MAKISLGKDSMFKITLVSVLLAVSHFAQADDSFNSIGGYSLGQSCTGSQFSKSDSYVRNPDEVLDKIEVKRSQIKKKLKDGYDLFVSCGIIDNKVVHLSLTADNSDDITVIKESLKEKMGRPSDDSDQIKSEPQSILGITMDGHNMESEKWYLGESKTATAYTTITIPYGSYSISDLKWRGGIELSVNDTNLSEWNYLKNKGSMSSKEEEALQEEKRKNRARSLLD